jgi:hypothetical protein
MRFSLQKTAHAALSSAANRKSGYARDDKGWGGAFLRHPSVQQPLSMEASPFPLSSRAQPRDLQFSGPFLEMFSDAR